MSEMNRKSYEDLMDEVRRADSAGDFVSAKRLYLEAQSMKENSLQPTPQAPAESQLGRTFAQGLTFGFADEIEAGVRSVLPDTLGGGEYDKIRDELRSQLASYKEQNPTTALTAEVAGAFLPSIVAMVYSGGTAAPAVAPTIGKLLKIGAAEGGLYGLGASEEEDVMGMARDTGIGIVEGGVTSGIVGKGLPLAAKGISGFIDFTKNALGDRFNKVVRNEIKRLKSKTGKSDAEIYQDLLNNRLPAENQTLVNVFKSYVESGGEAGRYTLSRFKDRTSSLKKNTLDDLQERLAPDADDNVYKAYKQSEKALKQAESNKYDEIFDTFPDLNVSDDAISFMNRAIEADPSIADDLNTVYGLKKLVPLFKRNSDGTIDFVRQPSLRDAEQIRRILSDKATTAYKGGQGFVGETFKGIERSLRSSIDEISKPLKEARANWATLKGGAESFKLGRNSLKKNVDELSFEVESLRKKPELFAAFKMGVMDAIRDKARRTKNSLKQLAEEDTQLGGVLRVALDGEDIASLERQLLHAGEVQEMAGKMPSTVGSPTAPLSREMNLTVSDVASMASGSPIGIASTIMSKISNKLKREAPQLTDAERLRVAEIMFNEAPEITERAITNQGAYNTLMANYGRIINEFGRGVSRATGQQAIQESQGLLNR